jgi:hypothetical protein
LCYFGAKKTNVIIDNNIESKILTIRGLQVMIDRDLAELYEESTKRLNQQVGRNLNRFPEDFMFQLTQKEKDEVVANCNVLKTIKHFSQSPYVFTEQGVAQGRKNTKEIHTRNFRTKLQRCK